MRWLEDLLTDGWWATGPAVRFQLPGQGESTLAYGELLRQAATLAARIGEPDESSQTRLAILTMGSAEGLIALMAGLIAGAVVISTPIQTTSPWSADLLGDPDVVVTDATGGAVLECHERLVGVKPDYRVLPIDLAEPGSVSARPRICSDQDDVCKIAYLDPGRSSMVVALTGFALDSAVRQPRRPAWAVPADPVGGTALNGLAAQLSTYRTLATGGVIDLTPRRPVDRKVLSAEVERTGRFDLASDFPTIDTPYIVDDPAQMDDLMAGITVPARSAALPRLSML